MLASKQVFTSRMPTALDIDTAARLRVVIGRLSRRTRTTRSGTAAGLTPTRISVLLHVVRSGQMRLSELAAAEAMNPTMLSRVVSDLAEAGLLERSSDAGDRRAALVKATPAGKRLAERMRRERTDALNVALDALSGQDRALVEDALCPLERLAENLVEKPPAERHA
jgi:DNA-binding MarR family transcriptional regulator